MNFTIIYTLINDNNIAFTVYYSREGGVKISKLGRLEFNINASGVFTSRVYISNTYNF